MSTYQEDVWQLVFFVFFYEKKRLRILIVLFTIMLLDFNCKEGGFSANNIYTAVLNTCLFLSAHWQNAPVKYEGLVWYFRYVGMAQAHLFVIQSIVEYFAERYGENISETFKMVSPNLFYCILYKSCLSYVMVCKRTINESLKWVLEVVHKLPTSRAYWTKFMGTGKKAGSSLDLCNALPGLWADTLPALATFHLYTYALSSRLKKSSRGR